MPTRTQTTSPTLKQLRHDLRRRVLDVLARLKHETQSAQILEASEWVICCDIAPFASAEAADAAEGSIRWATEHAAGEACRTGFAAMELKSYLQRLRPKSIVRIDPVGPSRDQKPDPSAICIQLRRVDPGGAFESPEAFGLDTDVTNRGIIISSASGIGLLYGVYELLQHWGVRFHAPGQTHIPAHQPITVPPKRVHAPSFRTRMSYSFRKNRATPQLLEWMGQNRLNLWGADNRVSGMYKRGIRLMCGNHDFLPVMGLSHNFCIHDERHRRHLRKRVVHEYSRGMWRDAEVIDYIGGDWAKRCQCEQCRAGNETDVELKIVHEIRQAVHQAYEEGRIDRDLPIKWYAYFDTLRPPKLGPPPGFDFDHCFGAVWSMRCWIHLLNEAECDEPMSRPNTMRDFVGRTVTEPTNRQIDECYRSWNQAGGPFAGRVGIGQYYYNAGLFWLPIPYQTILAVEMTYYRQFNSDFIGMMHLSPGDWGPKAVTYGLWARLAWDVQTDSVEWLADYYRVRYGELAAAACAFYFGLEEMMANTYSQRRFVLPTLKNDWSNPDKSLAPYEHLNGTGRGEGHGLGKMREHADRLDAELEKIERAGNGLRVIADDRRWFDYAADAVRLLHVVSIARNAYCDTGTWDRARDHLIEARKVAIRLHRRRLPITLPGKPRLSPYQSTGLVLTLARMLEAAGISLDILSDVPATNTRVDLQPNDEQDAAEIEGLTTMLRDASSNRSCATTSVAVDLPTRVLSEIRSQFRSGVRVGRVDVDLDGFEEYIVAGPHRDHLDQPRVKVVALKPDGKVAWQRSALEGTEPLGKPTGVDLDDDGYPEIVLLTSHAEQRSSAHLICLESFGGTHWDTETVDVK